MGITLKDIARELGVNQTTVSLVLNSHPAASKFTTATRDRIVNAAKHLGYHPNASARALAIRRTSNLGLVIPDHVEGQWKNPFYAAFQNGVNQVCRELDYNLLTFCCHMDHVDRFVFPKGIAGGGVDGILLCGYVNQKILERLDTLRVPVARLGLVVKEAEIGVHATFTPAIVDGLRQAIEYLSLHGHVRISTMNSGSPSSRAMGSELERITASSTQSVRLENYFTADARCDATAAKDFIASYFKLPEKESPTALISNPQTCLGILKEMARYNMRCPEHLSLISIYDYDVFDYITPGITALKFDNEAIAAFAANQLINQIVNAKLPLASKNDFPVTLNIRDSCRTL